MSLGIGRPTENKHPYRADDHTDLGQDELDYISIDEAESLLKSLENNLPDIPVALDRLYAD